MEKMEYKIPKDLIDNFIKEALQSRDNNGQVESLALVAGLLDGNQLIAKDLVFPKQKGTSFDVEDLGKQSRTNL